MHTSLLFRTNVTQCSKSTQSLISEWNHIIACWKHELTQQLPLASDTIRSATNRFAILCHSPKFVAVQHIWKDLCELKWENLVQNFLWRIKKLWIRFGGFHTVNLFTAFCDNCQVTMGPTILRGFCKKFCKVNLKSNKLHPERGSQNVLKPTWLFNELSWEKQGWAVQGLLYTYANVKDMTTFHSSSCFPHPFENPSSKKVAPLLCLQLATDFFLRWKVPWEIKARL